MPDKPISPLRQRMIDDMTARRFKEKVQKDYVRHVRTFAAFLGRSPDKATSEDLRRYQLHLAKQQDQPRVHQRRHRRAAVLFRRELERPDLVRPLTTVNKPRKAPVVLSEEEWRVSSKPRRASSTKPRSASPTARACGCPIIGGLSLDQIEISHITAIMLRAERAGAPDTARRVRSRIELVLNSAIAQGLRTATLINPAGGKLIAAAHPSKRKGERPHYRAVKIDEAQEVFLERLKLKKAARSGHGCLWSCNRCAAIGGARSALGRSGLRSAKIVDAPAGRE